MYIYIYINYIGLSLVSPVPGLMPRAASTAASFSCARIARSVSRHGKNVSEIDVKSSGICIHIYI